MLYILFVTYIHSQKKYLNVNSDFTDQRVFLKNTFQKLYKPKPLIKAVWCAFTHHDLTHNCQWKSGIVGNVGFEKEEECVE